jgi:hypothetical protein
MSHLSLRPTALAARFDRFGLAHGTDRADALAAFGDATEGVAAYRRDIMASLERALAAEPEMVAAHALKGLLLVAAARAETAAAARDIWRGLRPGVGTRDECVLVAALGEAVCRGPLAAAAILDAHLARRPDLLLFVKLCTMLRFMGGDAPGMRATTHAVLPAWRPVMPGYGYVLGCHAFGLEEAGEFAAAERAGRAAVELAPHDVWAVHAVAHVYEMTHRPEEGVAWIEGQRMGWRDCNSFAFHLSWHLGLLHLDQGDAERVLGLYDREIRPDRSEDNRDYTNAVAMLWRLRQHGIDVGHRWDELAEIARRRRHETTMVFASLHRLLALLAVGDWTGAADVAAALRADATNVHDEQSLVAASVGAELAAALLALLCPDGMSLPGRPPLAAIAEGLMPIGGSHAQRDLFVRTLAQLAGQRGDRTALADLLTLRRRMKQDDKFATLLAF